MILKQLLRTFLAASAMLQPGLAAAQQQGVVGTFRFGTEAAPAPVVSSGPDESAAPLDGSAKSFSIVGDANGWSYSNAPPTLIYSLVEGTLPPGARFLPTGKLDIPAFQPVGTTYAFTVRVTNAAGVSTDKSYVLKSAMPTAVAAAGAIPSAIVSSISGPISVVDLYDGATTTRNVAAGETITVRFSDFVEASDATVILAGTTSSSVTASLVAPDGSVVPSAAVMATPGSVAHPLFDGETVSKEFRFTFASSAVLADLRIGGAPEFSKPVVAFAQGASLGDIATLAGGRTAMVANAPTGTTLEVTAGALPPSATVQGADLVFASSAGPLGGPWSFSIRAVDPSGVRGDPVALSVGATSSVLAQNVLPTAATFTGTLLNPATGRSAPSRMLLQDGDATTGFTAVAVGQSAILDYGQGVAFGSIRLVADKPVELLVEQAPGDFRKIADLSGVGYVELDRTYVARRIMIRAASAATTVSEVGLGNAAASSYPQLAGVASRSFDPDQTSVLTASDFTASPWGGATTLAIVDAASTGATIVGNAVVVPSSPSASRTLKIRATSADGLSNEVSFTVLPTAAVPASSVMPRMRLGSAVAGAAPATPLYDGLNSAQIMSQSIYLTYSRPVSLSGLYWRSTHASSLYKVVGGTGTLIMSLPASTTGTSATVPGGPHVADTFYVAANATANATWTELRLGDGPETILPVAVGPAVRRIPADGVIAVAGTDFLNKSSYSKKVVLGGSSTGQTFSQETGDRIVISSRPTVDVSAIVRATDETGAYVDQSIVLQPAVDSPSAANASPSTLVKTASGTTVAAYVGQPDKAVVSDGVATSLLRFGAIGQYVELNYATPVSFDRIALDVSGPFQIQVYRGPAGQGSYFPAHTATAGYSGELVLDRTYNTQQVRIVPNGSAGATMALAEFRPGSAPASVQPVYAGTGILSPEADGTILRPTDFSNGTMPGIVLSVGYSNYGAFTRQGDGRLTITPNLTADSQATLRATAPDGSFLERSFTIRGTAAYASAATFPATLAKGTSGAVIGSPQTPIGALFDGSPATYYPFAGATQTIGYTYSNPVSVDKVFVSSNGTAVVQVMLAGTNAWVNAGTQTGTGTVTLDRPYATTAIRVMPADAASASMYLYEFRPGAGGLVAAPTYVGADILPLEADRTFVRPSDFVDNSPYSTGLTLSVVSSGIGWSRQSDGRLTLNGLPQYDAVLVVRATSADGSWLDRTVTVLAAAGAVAATTYPNSIGYTSAAPNTFTGQAPLGAVFDGVDNTRAVFGSTSQAVTLYYSVPVTFNKVALWTSAGAIVQIRTGSSSTDWTTVGTYTTAVNTVVTLGRDYTTNEVRILPYNSAMTLFEFRPGGGAASPLPTWNGPATLTRESDGTVVRPSDFANTSPYSTRLTLSVQNNGGLTFTTKPDGSLSLASVPVMDTEVVVRATSSTLDYVDKTITILAPPGPDAATVMPSYAYGAGSTPWYSGQPTVNTMFDGAGSSYFTVPNTNSYVQLDYANPVTLDKIYALVSSGFWYAQILQGNNYVSPQSDPIVGNVMPLRRAYTTKSLRLYTSASNVQVSEFKPGNGPWAGRPQYVGPYTVVPQADGTIVDLSNFTANNPYSTKLTLSLTSALSGIATDGSRIYHTAPLTSDRRVGFRASNTDGTFVEGETWVKATVAGADPATLVPSVSHNASMMYSSGSPTAYQILSDNTDTTWLATSGSTQPQVTYTYATPVQISSVNYWGTGLAIDVVDPVSGVWREMTSYSIQTGGMRNFPLGQTVTTTGIRMRGIGDLLLNNKRGLVIEMRPVK